MPETTPSQTVGPFFGLALPWPDGPDVVPEGTPGAIRLAGRILDGAGEGVPDAIVETWQADPDGRFDQRGAAGGFRGFGQAGTRPDGSWAIRTLKPGRVPWPDGGGGVQAPHIAVGVLARGLLRRVVTRIYFGDEPEANAADPVLATLDDAARATLLAHPVPGGYHFDIRLQGADETIFFSV